MPNNPMEIIAPNQSLQQTELSKSVNLYSTNLESYLLSLGLPHESVLVDLSERVEAIELIPKGVKTLLPEQRSKAMYISKFVTACGVGLFDAALNFLWDEVVLNLRAKVTQFDLSYFYDSVIHEKKRSDFVDENDLIKIEDWQLVQGAYQTGLLTDVGYHHLELIKYMRNHASAAHPNHNELTGLQLSVSRVNYKNV